MTGTMWRNDVPSPRTILRFPFGLIRMTGNESVDFLHRITSNDFTAFTSGNIQKTLLITDKGRILDAVWVIHRGDHILMLTSSGMTSDVMQWLNKYIVMEEIELHDASAEYSVDIFFNQQNEFYQSDYFGFPASFRIAVPSEFISDELPASVMEEFELWRIWNGIPKAKKELVNEFNPLELNLWDWISFSKGCYIGQEVIARLDTYNKIQRCLYRISSEAKIDAEEILIDDVGAVIGRITSVAHKENEYIGLAVIRLQWSKELHQVRSKDNSAVVTLEKIFAKRAYGNT